MKKKLILLVIMVLLAFSCTKNSPLEVSSYSLRLPGTEPTINRSELRTDHDFSVGYANGKIRSDRVSLSWQKVDDKNFLVYKIFRNNTNLITFADQNTTSLVDSNLVSGQRYFYKVAAILTNGASKVDTITVRTPGLLSPIDVNFEYLLPNSIRLFWKNRMESASEFDIYRRQEAEDFILKSTVTDTFYVDDSVLENRTYQYKIVPKNEFETGNSTITDITVRKIFNAPSNLSVEQVSGTRSVHIQWSDNANCEENYWVYRDDVSIVKLPANAISYVDHDTTTSLQIGNTYAYHIRVTDREGTTLDSAPYEILIIDPNQQLPLEGFENGVIPVDWTTGGDVPWFVTNSNKYMGVYSVQSGGITDNQESILTTSFLTNSFVRISFYYKVSSEMNYDFLEFYINGVLNGSWSGELAWRKFQTTYFSTGIIELRWRYMKDGSEYSGSDCAWIDQLVVE